MKKLTFKTVRQKPFIVTSGDLWRLGWFRMVIYPKPDRLVIYKGNKEVGEFKYYLS